MMTELERKIMIEGLKPIEVPLTMSTMLHEEHHMDLDTADPAKIRYNVQRFEEQLGIEVIPRYLHTNRLAGIVPHREKKA